MPTAVERLLDSFLKFDNAREQLKLDDAFLKIDEALQKLANVNGDGFNFLKIEHDLKLTDTFNVIGGAFLKLGDDFHKVETAGHIAGDFVVKLLGDHKIGDLLPAVQTDFKVLDHKIEATSTDLKILGVDFLKLDSSPNQRVFDHKVQTVGDDFLKLGADLKLDGAAFNTLGMDFLELARKAGGDPKSALDNAYKEFGGELVTIGQTFGTLADSFANVGNVLHGTGGGEGDNANTIGGALSLIYQEFHLLDKQFSALGDGSVRLISLLMPAGHEDNGLHLGNGAHGGGGG